MQEIPFIDIRDKSTVTLVEEHADRALRLIHASRDVFGMASRLASHIALPVGDTFSRRWLDKTNNPYLAEIDAYAKLLPTKGVYALNMCYEWGCTSGAYRNGEGVTLTRVLDWPFPSLGENIVIAHQRGKSDDFYNITWPGVSGIFQAVAPGRFAAALNQAPMRRYKTGIFIDWARNRGKINRHTGLPPAHLLRHVFETATDYESAKEMLSTLPVSIPVIYILSGTKENQGCVIERLEETCHIRELNAHGNACAANHFESPLNGVGHGWLPRALDSHGRAKTASSRTGKDITGEFAWFTAPIANPLSRLALMADAAKGSFSVMGTDGVKPVTKVFSISC